MGGPGECLEELGKALAAQGLVVRLVEEETPLLHVTNPEPPALRELIGCRIGPGSVLWFYWAALDVLLAPVDDVPAAVERVAFVLDVPGDGHG